MISKSGREKNSVILIVIAVLIFAGGFVLGRSSASAYLFINSEPPKDVDMSPVWKVWNVIDAKFVPTRVEKSDEKTGYEDKQKRVWGMASGLAASLGDPYTVFLPPSENKMFNEDISGSFEGVGMEIAVRDGILTVVSPLKGTPAEKAGLKPGDKIIEIDGESTEGISIDVAVKKIRGPKGTKVKFKIIREGEPEPLKIEVVRDKIDIPTIDTKVKEDVFIISLYSFTAEASRLFANALADFINSGKKKLIIDLRGNPGGYLDAAVNIAGYFLPQGTIVVTEDFGNKRPAIVHKSKGGDLFPDVKVVVLIDKGSASASEILAGALKAHKRATIIGQNSFGKGSVQELVPITKDTSLKVTVARFLLPDGSWIMEKGIEPDIKVELPKKEELICDPKKKEELENKDLILEKAFEFLKTGK